MNSLKNLCLNLIAKEFEVLHFAYTVSNDEVLRQNFEFLQIFSSELASRLFKNDDLNADYLQFFINPRLKFLNLKWIEYCVFPNSLKSVFRRLPHLEELSCGVINDKILKYVAKFCPKIVQIKSEFSEVTNNGIKYLCNDGNGKVPCPDLKALFLFSLLKNIDEGVKCLIQDLPRLEKIKYQYLPSILYSLYKESLCNLGRLPSYNLVRLEFYDDYCIDLLKVCLAVCPRLKSVKLEISDVEQLNVFNNTSLEEFDLNVSDTIGGININDFLKNNGSKFVSLEVRNCLMSIKVLSASCPNLRNLSMYKITFLEDYCCSLSVLHYLTECTFCLTKDDNTTSRAICLLLSSSPNLERLEFKGCAISPDIGTHIFKYCKNNLLKYVTFCNSVVRVELLTNILLSSSRLKNLRLNGCDYLHDSLRELEEFAKSLPNKPKIYIDGIFISQFYLLMNSWIFIDHLL